MTERGDGPAAEGTACEQTPTRNTVTGAPPADSALSPASGGPAQAPGADRG